MSKVERKVSLMMGQMLRVAQVLLGVDERILKQLQRLTDKYEIQEV